MPDIKQESRREIAVAIVRKHYEIVADVALAPSQRRLVDAFEAALNDERERAAKVADERAAFNRRLAHGSKISDTIDSRVADLKLTRADEAEVIAGEIREGKQSQDYATVRANSAVAAIRNGDTNA